MKQFFLILFFILTAYEARAVCSSPIARTNASANSVLTSTRYNTDLNTVYDHVNDIDGDCITDSTIDFAKIDTSTAAPLTDAVKEGCALSFSDSNTISVSKCYITVNGNQIEKTTATTVTWGCGSCSAEVSATTYYIYATSASTLTLKISTTAPDGYGYNSTDRVLGRFYNDSSSDIDRRTITDWIVTGFVADNRGPSDFIHLGTGAGHGSTNTRVRRIETTFGSNGSMASACTQSATLGTSCTVPSDGLYSVTYIDYAVGGVCQVGINLNGSALTTTIGSQTYAQGLRARINTATSNSPTEASVVLSLKSGDIVRPMTDGGCDNTAAYGTQFSVTKLSN